MSAFNLLFIAYLIGMVAFIHQAIVVSRLRRAKRRMWTHLRYRESAWAREWGVSANRIRALIRSDVPPAEIHRRLTRKEIL